MKNAFFSFMASTTGRIARVVAGVALIALGFVIGGVGGWIIAIVGLVPLLAGLFDVCVFSRLFGGPFRGSDIRSAG
jgi:hypothetical protein